MNQHPGERDAAGFDAAGGDAVGAPAPNDSPGVAADDTADVAPDAADAVDDGAGHNRAGAAPDAADAVNEGAGADSTAAAPEGAVGASAGDECGEAWGYPGDAADTQALAALAEELRAGAVRDGAAAAVRLRQVARLAGLVEATARRMLAAGPRVSGQPDDLQVIDTAVTGEVQAVFGISAPQASRMVDLARWLTRLPNTLSALEQGRLDESRARVLAEATALCTDAVARQVEATVLPATAGAPWEGPAPRNWRARVERAVVTADPHTARERRERALAERELRTWPDRDGTGVLRMRAGLADISLAEQVVSGLAHGWPSHDEHGRKLSMDQRRVDSVMDLLRRVLHGQPLPGMSLGGRREVGLVLHADTLLGHGPAAADPGQLRGLGVPATVDPTTARELARAQIAAGAPTCVYLTDTRGVLQRLVRLTLTPEHGWTRETLTAAVRAALPDLPALHTDRYTPTAAITDHVHAKNPHCTAYDCPRVARHCDLDHDQPWPRGPTDATNLHPRSRRHHELKTRGLVTTRLQPDGTVTTRMLTGLSTTTRPEPLPGHAPGEGHHPG